MKTTSINTTVCNVLFGLLLAGAADAFSASSKCHQPYQSYCKWNRPSAHRFTQLRRARPKSRMSAKHNIKHSIDNDGDTTESRFPLKSWPRRFWFRLGNILHHEDRIVASDQSNTSSRLLEDGLHSSISICSEEKESSGSRLSIPKTDYASVFVSQHSRWAFPSNSTDLSGVWKPLVTDQFKRDYDEYLQNCSQTIFFRNLFRSTVGLTREEIVQDGRNLHMTSSNPMGQWKRSLVSSGWETDCNGEGARMPEPIFSKFKDPDGDEVEVEAWWEDEGTKHKSILRGKPRVNGGTFVTSRYLDATNGDILVCDSSFEPPQSNELDLNDRESKSSQFRPGFVRWKYKRLV